MVESALVLPLYVFLMLGIIQLSLMHQAQLMTKYAAYRAVRAGAMHNADRWTMETTSAQVVLPKFASDPIIGFQSSGPRLRPTTNAAEWGIRYAEVVGLYGTIGLDLPPTMVTTCGPLRQHFSNLDPECRPGEEADFDDLCVLYGPSGQASWEDYSRTKLRVQVLFNYRMPIPFANDVIARIALAQEINRALMLDNVDVGLPRELNDRVWNFIAQLLAALQNREYVLPIRANYSMRMMSNIHMDNLPDRNECVLKFEPQEAREFWGLE